MLLARIAFGAVLALASLAFALRVQRDVRAARYEVLALLGMLQRARP